MIRVAKGAVDMTRAAAGAADIIRVAEEGKKAQEVVQIVLYLYILLQVML